MARGSERRNGTGGAIPSWRLTDVVGASGHPVTQDGRYFVIRDRLWRMSDPGQ
jgi:hypothetical protein